MITLLYVALDVAIVVGLIVAFALMEPDPRRTKRDKHKNKNNDRR